MLPFPVLRAEIAKRGIKKNAIAQALTISVTSFKNKLNGKTSFTWPEVCTINERFFPDMDKDTLFRREEATDERTD